MPVLGASKYGEKILALYRANLDNIRSTVEKEEELVAQHGLDSGCGHCYGPRRWSWTGSESEYLQVEAEALFYAHSLFENICVHAMVDASDVKEDPAAQEGTTSSLLDRGWKDMCKVVEMQLSLMYDVLYTKASVIHVKLDENVATYLGSPRLPVIYSKAQVHGARTTQGIAVRFTFLAIDLDSVTNSLFLEYISNQVYFQF